MENSKEVSREVSRDVAVISRTRSGGDAKRERTIMITVGGIWP